MLVLPPDRWLVTALRMRLNHVLLSVIPHT